MCRMLALAGIPNALATQALQDFFPLCTKGKVRPKAEPGHLDGWGIAGFEKGQPVFFGRRPVPASLDEGTWKDAAERASVSGSPVLLAHFRKASKGSRSLENTHPFQREGWIFCHNGTVEDHEKLTLNKLRPEGQTDSERIFLYLLEALGTSPGSEVSSFRKALAELRKNFPFTSLTFLMSDGLNLYAYRSFSDQLLGPGENAKTREGYYTLWTAEAEGGRLVCSERILKDKNLSWTLLNNNELVVFPVKREV